MFWSTQILSLSTLVRNISQITAALDASPQALLITRKGRKSLVLVNAELFESLIEERMRRRRAIEGEQHVDWY